jgi:hypothetical protein
VKSFRVKENVGVSIRHRLTEPWSHNRNFPRVSKVRVFEPTQLPRVFCPLDRIYLAVSSMGDSERDPKLHRMLSVRYTFPTRRYVAVSSPFVERVDFVPRPLGLLHRCPRGGNRTNDPIDIVTGPASKRHHVPRRSVTRGRDGDRRNADLSFRGHWRV